MYFTIDKIHKEPLESFPGVFFSFENAKHGWEENQGELPRNYVLKALGNGLKRNWSSYASATFLKQNNTHCREGVLTYDRCTKHRDIRLGFSKHKVTDLFWVRIYGLQHGLNVK